ncbi:membrane fusion protein, multidrug efflux system [Tistlia consotensis]|uniref:Membrane fusion protein, multidrug efflux system n=1 Tax=Tistlia consotensis USBA 355 TaxID=560819 RepID=A0A1Y6CM88_9PROT|nr:HlyD family secretion protein [Tistlia consotensis]SMF73400.1 membrane fusion protein, multidrug efflux system [Tistlia consotensis USBA 355]SNS30455.1 membrane fusion protein, multidrug efflux system [Tistlia consotensis]
MSEAVLERRPAAPAVKSRPRLRYRRLALAAALLAAGAAVAWYAEHWWSEERWLESTDDAYVGGDVTEISPHVPGFVAKVLVADNQRVQAGQLLIQLDDRDLRAALARAEAVERQRQATLASLRARLVLQQSSIGRAEAELAARRAESDFARQDAERYRRLASSTAGSRQSAQKSASVEAGAKAAVRAAEAGLAAARQQLVVLDTGISEAEAAVSEAGAELRQARLDLGYAQIRSPIDGYIGNRAARVGAYVQAGRYLVTIVPARGLWIDANFKEDQLAHMKPGQPATVVADMMPGRTLHGQVASLAPATGATFSVIPPQNATGNFTKIVQRVPVRILLDEGGVAAERLRPGLSTTVTVDTAGD